MFVPSPIEEIIPPLRTVVGFKLVIGLVVNAGFAIGVNLVTLC